LGGIGKTRIVVAVLGGIGKIQKVVEYAYRSRNLGPGELSRQAQARVASIFVTALSAFRYPPALAMLPGKPMVLLCWARSEEIVGYENTSWLVHIVLTRHDILAVALSLSNVSQIFWEPTRKRMEYEKGYS
jgi:hypothetical protein